MKTTQLFTKTSKTIEHDAESKNARLLTQAGFIKQEMAGVFAYMPLGFRVLQKIMNIIREEMNAIGGQEILLTALQNPENWKKTKRWGDDVIDIWFKTKLANGTEIGLGNTHEEPLTEMMKQFVQSYKDLPVYPYQMQTKFRNELRAKSGILRSREFIMKDMYSFSATAEDHDAFYEKAKEAYFKIFRRIGIGDATYLTFASGGAFSKFSHEFQTLCEAGEDIIYIDETKKIAINKEVYNDEVFKMLDVNPKNLKERKAIEVGNIFTLGTRFSEALDLKFSDKEGKKHAALMGCYGIGPGRVMGTVVELLADDKGLVWPENIAPFKVIILSLGKDEKVKQSAEDMYNALMKQGVEVMWDDRDTASAGEKFTDADLLGIPHRIVISKKTVENESYEYSKRTGAEKQMLKKEAILKIFDK